MKIFSSRLMTAASIVAIVTAAGAGARAADPNSASQPTAGDAPAGLEEVIVTAQKRSEKLQTVPITITAVNAQTLANHDVKTLQDLSTVVSGFDSQGDNGTNEPHLRGVGNAIISPGNDAGVSYYIDGVYIPSGLSSPISLSDSADVEVLKGPQGTLFGRNATAGVILINTRDPKFDHWEIEGQLGYGNYNTVSTEGFIGGPVTDSIATDFAFSASHQADGWGKNLVDNHDTGAFDQAISVHNKWIFNISDDTDLRLNMDYQRFRGVGTWDYHHFPNHPIDYDGNPWNNELSSVMTALNNLGGVSAKLTHDFGFATLTNIAAYRQATNSTFGLDSSVTPYPDEQFFYFQNAHEYTEELQLASESDGPLQWTTGFYYLNGFDQGEGHVNIYGILPGGAPFPAYLNASQNTESTSGFAQATYSITDSTKLTGGVRYTSETRDLTNLIGPQNARPSISANLPTWRVALNQQLDDDLMVYASISRGFKSGGFNLTAAAAAPPFGPERLTSYEVGAKSEFFDKRLRLNVSGFYYDYKGIQQTTLVGALETVYNAAGAEVYGLDADLDAIITNNFKVNGGLELLHSDYTSFDNCTQYHPVAGGFESSQGACTGNRLVQAPTVTFFLAPEYTIPTNYGNYLLTASYSYNSGYVQTPDGSLRQPAFGLLGASAQFTTTDEKYWVRIWGKNLTDEVTTSVAGYNGPVGLPLQQSAMLNAPRTYGITFGVKFGTAPQEPPAQAAYVPPPPQAPAQAPKSYLVFFDFNKSDLTSQAVEIVDTAAKNAATAKVTQLTVTGHTDTVGSDAYNMRLSRRRAESVAAQLEKDGIPSGEIAIVARGKRDLLVPTADGVREPQNRRVQIVYSDGASS